MSECYDEGEGDWPRRNTWRDGQLHVMAAKCSTCIYRPGNLMDLRPGTKDRMEQESVAEQTVITCHKTLGTEPQTNAVCRGYFDTQKAHVALLQVAERLGVITEQKEDV